MTAIIIGISTGLLNILLFVVLKQLEKKLLYGLVLTGIGFLYVGFTWTDLNALVVTAIQAIVFVFLSYYGVKRSTGILAAGYFLHGCWDLAYNFIATPGLVPPHYDLFCSSLDFTVGIYLLLFSKQLEIKKNIA